MISVKSEAIVLALASFALLGCAPKQPEAKAAEAPPAEGAKPEAKGGAEPGAPSIPWSQKDRQQRMEYMGLYVLPKMKALFQEHDAKQFKDFKCQTCHGDDMEAVDFKMPNALYALPAENTLEAAKDYDAKITDFMASKVMPSMAELLGAEPLNPQTGQGFSCFNCHQKE